MTLNTSDLFAWDYGSHYTWGIADGDLGLLRVGGRDYLFGESVEDKLQTKIFAAVLALFFESSGYLTYWWGSPSPIADSRGGGWQMVDNQIHLNPINGWTRIPGRQESMAAMQLWASRQHMYVGLMGLVAKELSWGLHNPKPVELLTLYAVCRRNRKLAMNQGWFFTESEFPQLESGGPIPWTDIAAIYK